MKLIRTLPLFLFTLFFFEQKASALLEIRGGYSLLRPAKEIDANGAYKLEMQGYHADVIVDPPLFPIGFGLRYESLSGKRGNDVTNGDIKDSWSRLSGLINYRFIDTVLFMGLIGTVSVNNKLVREGQHTGTLYTLDQGTTYSLGFEAGASLLIFQVGAEIGYMMGELKDSAGLHKFNSEGAYGKAHIGFSF